MHLFIFFFTIYGVNVLFYSMNSMYKFFIFIFTVPVFLIGSQFAQIGDNVSLTLDTSASYSNKSNIYKSTTEISDDVFTHLLQRRVQNDQDFGFLVRILYNMG